MTTRKITLALLTAAALMVAITGCSKSSAPETTPGEATSDAVDASVNSDANAEEKMEIFVAPNTPENTEDEVKALEDAYEARKNAKVAEDEDSSDSGEEPIE